MTVGSLALSPAFDPDILEYTVNTTNAKNTITATPKDPDALIQVLINSSEINNGSQATWEDGENVVGITVINGDDTRQYTITVTKA